MLVDRRREMMMAASVGVDPVDTGRFGNVVFCQNFLVYESGKFRFQRTWNEVNSYGSKYGLINGSTYFNYNQIKDINLDGYQPISKTDLEMVVGGSGTGGQTQQPYLPYPNRNASTYNGTPHAFYAFVIVSTSYAGVSNIKGCIMFPDDVTITGPSLTLVTPSSSSRISTYTSITLNDLNNLLSQGVLFLPYAGARLTYNWDRRNDSFNSQGRSSKESYGSTFSHALYAYDMGDSTAVLGGATTTTNTSAFGLGILCRPA